MKMHVLGAALVAVLLGAPALAAAAEPAAPPAPAPVQAPLTGPQVGQPAPPFALTTIDGRKVTLDSYRGKTLVLNVWATWCPPCRGETADLIKSYSALHSPQVAFLGVDDTEEAPIVRAFVAAKGIAYPQAIDAAKTFSKAYDIRYFPTTFVIDPSGIVRARNIDVVTPDLLKNFVASAQAGKDVAMTSAQQQKIDALLAGPFSFEGGREAVVKSAKAVDDAIAKAEDLANNSDPANGQWTDLLRSRAEEAVIRDRAIAALEPVATTDSEKVLLAKMRGDAASDREEWSAALAAYDSALALEPKNEDVLGGIAFVTGPLKDYPRMLDANERLVALHPDDVGGIEGLADAYASAKQFEKAETTIKRATELALKHLAKKPHDAKLTRTVASTHLVAGRIYARAGNVQAARIEFALLVAWTKKLPKTDARYAMYLEEAQEARVALDLTGDRGATTVSLTPWTGPDLPGSLASTMKYRLVVTGKSGKSVDLHAAGVPKGWVASFCSDRVCAPFKVSVELPQSGVKVIEFQLVPPGSTAATPKVRVIGTDGSVSSTATT